MRLELAGKFISGLRSWIRQLLRQNFQVSQSSTPPRVGGRAARVTALLLRRPIRSGSLTFRQQLDHSLLDMREFLF